MVDIRKPSYYGSGDPDTITLIQFADGREPMIHKLWCHGID